MKATVQFHELRAFVAAVRSGSFTRAAVPKVTQNVRVSRVVTRFEARLKMRLLQRSTGSLALTVAGSGLYERSNTILSAPGATQSALVARQARRA